MSLSYQSVLTAFVVAVPMAVTSLSGAARAEAPRELFSRAAEGSTLKIDHSVWDKLLKTYVRPGPDGINRIRYAAFKRAGHESLKSYLDTLHRVDPSRLDRREQFAFLANLYNATTIDVVLDHYPVDSIKDINLGGSLLSSFTGGPWKAKILAIKGVRLSLDDIEHGILRPVFKDPRVHYAVNCASIGCPNLGTEAFTGMKLDSQLDAAARAYVNHPRGVRAQGGMVRVSSIYSWFKADFGGSDAGVLAHLGQYASPELSRTLRSFGAIAGHDYDWRLNDAVKGDS
mgnify:CR=1 FL=1